MVTDTHESMYNRRSHLQTCQIGGAAVIQCGESHLSYIILYVPIICLEISSLFNSKSYPRPVPIFVISVLLYFPFPHINIKEKPGKMKY